MFLKLCKFVSRMYLNCNLEDKGIAICTSTSRSKTCCEQKWNRNMVFYH